MGVRAFRRANEGTDDVCTPSTYIQNTEYISDNKDTNLLSDAAQSRNNIVSETILLRDWAVAMVSDSEAQPGEFPTCATAYCLVD